MISRTFTPIVPERFASRMSWTFTARMLRTFTSRVSLSVVPLMARFAAALMPLFRSSLVSIILVHLVREEKTHDYNRKEAELETRNYKLSKPRIESEFCKSL